MNDSATRDAIAKTEAELSGRIHSVIVGSSVHRTDGELQNGDLVGIVTTEPGRLVAHAGFIVRGGRGATRFLHASSHHRRVVLTIRSLADYVLRRPERWGIIVARPLPPVPSRGAPAAEEPSH